jgi:hypothetical protein
LPLYLVRCPPLDKIRKKKNNKIREYKVEVRIGQNKVRKDKITSGEERT